MRADLIDKPGNTSRSERRSKGTLYGTRMSVGSGMRVPYLEDVADQTRVDRAKWATLVREIIDRQFEGNQSKFARHVQVTPKTVGRWLDQANDVLEASVREVARALERDVAGMLAYVGYYTDAEIRKTTPTALGYTILQHLAESGMRSEEDLAKVAEVTADEVRELVYAKNPTVAPDVRNRIGTTLGLSVADLEPAAPVVAEAPYRALVQELASALSSSSGLTVEDRDHLASVVDALLRPYRTSSQQVRGRTA